MAVSSLMEGICSEREEELQTWPQSSEKSMLSVQKEIARWWKKCDQKRERGGLREKRKREGH